MAVNRTTDYTGRKIDMMLTSNFEGPLEFVVPNEIVSGIQKLVQIFYTLFLTSVGSKFLNPEDGSTFANQLYNGRTFSRQNFRPIVNIAVSEVSDIILEDQDIQGVSAPDERLANAEVIDANLEGDSIDLSIRLRSEAGVVYEFVLPIKLPITSF